MQWLIHDIADGPPPDLSFIADVTARAAYEEAIREFRYDHPFRDNNSWSSPIFRAYVVAKLFEMAPRNLMWEAGSESGLLFEFICGSHAEPLILSETQFASLHASLIAGQWSNSDAAVIVTDVDGDFEVNFIHGSNDTVSGAVGGIIDPAIRGELTIRGPLTGLSVSIEGTINVPNEAGDIQLGPDLFLQAERISISGSQLAFGRRNDVAGAVDVSIQVESELILPQKIVPPLPQPDI